MPQNAATLKTQIKDASLTSNINYLQPTGFRIVINRKRYPNLEYFAQGVVHPSLSVPAVTLPFQKSQGIPMPGSRINYSNSIDFRLLLDENLDSYKEMKDWLERSINQNYTTSQNIKTKIASHHDITLFILSSHNNTTNKILYKDCIPTDLGRIEFSATGDGSYVTFQATFAFSSFEFK